MRFNPGNKVAFNQSKIVRVNKRKEYQKDGDNSKERKEGR